jgi:hypothetical protein
MDDILQEGHGVDLLLGESEGSRSTSIAGNSGRE